jgi:hypothetical protein
VKDNPFFASGKGLGTFRKSWHRTLSPSRKGIQVWVSHIDEEAGQDGLDRDRVKAEVEWRLAMAGIPVFYEQSDPGVPACPCLGVILNVRKAEVSPPCYTFSVEVFFLQGPLPEEQPDHHHMQMTWCKETIGDTGVVSQGVDWSGLLAKVNQMVETFIRDYQAAHPPFRQPLMVN